MHLPHVQSVVAPSPMTQLFSAIRVIVDFTFGAWVDDVWHGVPHVVCVLCQLLLTCNVTVLRVSASIALSCVRPSACFLDVLHTTVSKSLRTVSLIRFFPRDGLSWPGV